MTDFSYQELKQHIFSSLDISSTDLAKVAASFSKLYREFQTDAVKQVTIEKTPDSRFKWIYSKNSTKQKVLLFFHGGGFTMGSTEDHLELIAQIVIKTNVSVLSVDYRLVPEFQFPVPLEDVSAAYQWLLQQGYDSQQIGFAGISAGGLLVTQLILKSIAEKISLPKYAVVMSGPCNLNFSAPSFQYNADRDWINLARLQHVQQNYLPKTISKFQNLLSPIDATYEKYPATLFQAGDYELLLDDSLAFYQKLRLQQQNVFLSIISGLPHCWQLFAKNYAPGRNAINEVAEFICNQK